jgi:hypothetical protein
VLWLRTYVGFLVHEIQVQVWIRRKPIDRTREKHISSKVLAYLQPILSFVRNILISEDTNYIQSLQQRNILIAVRIHTTKKEKRKLRNKSLGNSTTSTTKTTSEIQTL